MKLSFTAFLALANAAVASAVDMSTFSFVFSMTNEAKNEVIAWQRDTETGELHYPIKIGTGGSGGSNVGLNAQFQPAFPNPNDPLGSQDPMTVSRNCLLVVNGGSNEVSSLQIIAPTKIRLAGTYSTGGTFPISVAATDDLVYVLNAGFNGSIQGYSLSQDNCALTPIGETIELEQTVTPFNDQAPELVFGAASPAQIGFTPNGDILVTIKVPGGQAVPGTLGTLNHYAIGPDGTTSADALTVTSVPRPLSSPFAFDFNSNGDLLLNEVNVIGDFLAGTGLGGVSFWEETDGSYTEIADPVSVDQVFTCWMRYNPFNQCTYFTSSLSTGAISTVRPTGDGEYELVESLADQVNGPLDLVISNDGKYLYVYSSGATMSPVTGGGQPRIVVYALDDDCGVTVVEEQAEGYSPVAENTNGPTGVAIFPNINARPADLLNMKQDLPEGLLSFIKKSVMGQA